MKTFFIILITAVLAAAATWFITNGGSPAAGSSAAEKPLFYQSAMHPWIKSDKPGTCTICGMALTPIYPGDQPMDQSGDDNIVTLAEQQVRILGVRTAEAKIHPLARQVPIAGIIEENATRHRVISAYVDGRIEKLHVNFMGAEVTANQPLADIYSPALLQAEREYRQLDGQLRQNTALRLRQMGLTRNQIDAISQKTADSLVSQILAPIGGTVVSQDVYEGQYVTTGQQLFEIADFSTMWFMAIVYEQDLPWIEIGQSVAVTTPSIHGKSFTGKITFIEPTLDEATRSVRIRVEIPNPLVNGRREILNKLYADGVVQVEIPLVLSIPRTAIIQTGPQAVVYTDQGGGAYKQVLVETGRRGESLIEILSGLAPGDRVVTEGNLLIDGQAELNRSFTTAPEEPVPAAPDGVISADQAKAITAFLTTTDTMAAALADDDLAAFNQASEPAMTVTTDLTAALAGMDMPPEKIEELEAARHFHGSDTIAQARSRFLRFSMAATDLLDPLRRMEDFPDMQVWQCPMVNQAIPDAAAKGRWIQTGNRPIRNPYFGAEMLECGVQLKP